MSGYTLDTNIQSSTLFLDSTNCVSRSPTFKYSLASPIICPTSAKMLMSTVSISLPNVINNVTEYNNIFSIQAGAVLTNYTIVIPVGIYSAWSFRDYLNSEFITRGVPVNCIYSNNSFKYTFVSEYEFNIKNTTAHPTTCGHLIGVAKDNSNQFVYPIAATIPYWSLVMPSTINFSPTSFIFLKVNGFNLSNINSLGVINNTLVRFPVNAEYGQMIQYRPTELNRFLIQRSSIISMDISLEDVHNNPLSIPSGAELQVTLKFDYIFPLPEQVAYNAGTIFHYLKENPIDENVDDGAEELGN